MTSLRANKFNVNMLGHHSHDMVVPDFIVQSAGSSDGGWHNMVGLGSDVDSEANSECLNIATRLSLSN
jgi:hypothetical protein